MNTLMWLLSFLKSGAASFFTSGIETLHFKVSKKRIDFDLMNKELLMDFLKTNAKEESPLKGLTALKTFAHELKKEGLTLTISYRGSLLLMLGSEANPTFSQFLTRTDAIEINDLKLLKQMRP